MTREGDKPPAIVEGSDDSDDPPRHRSDVEQSHGFRLGDGLAELGRAVVTSPLVLGIAAGVGLVVGVVVGWWPGGPSFGDGLIIGALVALGGLGLIRIAANLLGFGALVIGALASAVRWLVRPRAR